MNREKLPFDPEARPCILISSKHTDLLLHITPPSFYESKIKAGRFYHVFPISVKEKMWTSGQANCLCYKSLNFSHCLNPGGRWRQA